MKLRKIKYSLFAKVLSMTTYNGKLVRWSEDFYSINGKEMVGLNFLNENGAVDVYAVRDLENPSKSADGSADPSGALTGIEKFSQKEFDEHTKISLPGAQAVGSESYN